MNYNYPQQQFPIQGQAGYRPITQFPQWPQTTTPLGSVRPVSSIEEVRAYPIDFDGSTFYFADIANKKIYTKQINLDGTVSINLYELQEFSKADQSADLSFVTKQEFEDTVNKIRIAFESLLNKPKEEVVETKIESVQPTAAQPQQQTFIF